MGKGIRDAPRDALVADITGQTQRGAAYGLRQALDSVGAVLGPVLAVLLMLFFSGVASGDNNATLGSCHRLRHPLHKKLITSTR